MDAPPHDLGLCAHLPLESLVGCRNRLELHRVLLWQREIQTEEERLFFSCLVSYL